MNPPDPPNMAYTYVGIRYNSDESEDENDIVLCLALQNYETFHSLPPGSATLEHLIHSSAGIAGWARFVPNESTSNRTKSEHNESIMNAAPSTVSPPRRRKGDEEEARSFQLALLESNGVHIGHDAKQSLLHNADYDVNCCGHESDGDDSCGINDGDWSVEYEEDCDDDLESMSLQSTSPDNGETGLSPLAEALCINSAGNETDDSQDSASSFVIVTAMHQGKHISAGSSDNEERNDHTGLSPLTEQMSLDSSEDDGQDSGESFVLVTTQDHIDSSASSDLVLL